MLLLFVLPATLILRPDMECLVEQALAQLPEQPCRVPDPGTGIGAIALTLASERPDCKITAVDRMPGVVSPAQRNAQHLAIKNIHTLQGDWFSTLAGQQFAIIVSNPPYINGQDPHPRQGDVRPGPLITLVAADGGTVDIVHIIEQSRNVLVSSGFLPLEHGWQQGEAVRQAFIFARYHDVEICRDYGDNERVTFGYYYQ